MSTNNASKITESAIQAHHLKRKRTNEEEDEDEEDEGVIDITDSQPSSVRRTASSTTLRSTTGAVTAPPPRLPPLQDIPETISVLYEVIRHGGCPQCGSALHCRRRRSSSSSSRNAKIQGPTRNNCYTCDACHKEFHLPPSQPSDRNNKDNSFGLSSKKCSNNNNNNNNNNPSCPDDKNHSMFQSKRHLQRIVNYAQSEILKKEMKNDQRSFRKQVKDIVAQITEKRKYISDCLGIALGGDNNDGITVRRLSSTTATTAASDRTSPTSSTIIANNARNNMKVGEIMYEKANNDNNNVDDIPRIENDPFQESIQLLKQETSVMEEALNYLLDVRDGNLSEMLSSLRGPDNNSRSSWQRRYGGEADTGTIIDANNDVDIVNDYPSSKLAVAVSSKSVMRDGETTDAMYVLASRVMQEDGEEIEIYEKDMNTS